MDRCAHGLAECPWCWSTSRPAPSSPRCPGCGRFVNLARACDRCHARDIRAPRLPFRAPARRRQRVRRKVPA